MKYIHPDVLDSGLLHLRANAVRALLLPDYSAGMTYAQAATSALGSATISSLNFALSDDGTGRKIVFNGADILAMKSHVAGTVMHVALTDGIGRLLLVDAETSGAPIVVGKTYSIPAITYAVQQPQ
jgi:hypothetical protein